jgi:hypothetical protein
MSQAMANSFREWNRMLIDQQQWDVEHEKIQADKENAHMLNVERAKDMAIQREQAQLNIQAQRQQNILNSLKVKGVEEYMKPRPVNIYNYLPPGFHQDKEQLNAAKQVFTDLDPDVGFSLADGLVVDDTGAPIMMDGSTIEQKIPFLADIRRGFIDGPTQWKEEYESVMPQYEAAVKEYAKARKGHPAENQQRRQAAFAQMQQLGPLVKELASKMDDIEGHYDTQAAYFDSRAAWAAANHMRDAETFYTGRANDFRSRRDAYTKAQSTGLSKAKNHAMYDTDPNSPTYGHAVDFWKGREIDQPDLPGNRSWVRPPALKGSGDKEDSIKPDQVLDNIDKQYQMAVKGAVIPDPLLEEKANTHKSIFRSMILMKDANGKKMFTNLQADQEAQSFIDRSSNQYWNEVMSYKGKNPKQVMAKAEEFNKAGGDKYKETKGWDKLSADDKQYRRQIGQLFRMWKTETKPQFTPGNINRLMGEWELYRWKHEVGLATGLPWDTVYTPSKYTRSKKLRMQRLGSKVFEKEQGRDK